MSGFARRDFRPAPTEPRLRAACRPVPSFSSSGHRPDLVSGRIERDRRARSRGGEGGLDGAAGGGGMKGSLSGIIIIIHNNGQCSNRSFRLSQIGFPDGVHGSRRLYPRQNRSYR